MEQYKSQPILNEEFNFERSKTILFYNSFFGRNDFYFGFGHQPFVDAKCPVYNCFTTDNKTLLGKKFIKSLHL
jgi:hypothetical protein